MRTQRRRQPGLPSFKGNLKKIYRREQIAVNVYSQSLCMLSCQNGNVSCYRFVPAGFDCRLQSCLRGGFFDLYAFLRRCARSRPQFPRCSTSVSRGGQSGTGVVGPDPTQGWCACSYLGQKYSTLSLIMQNCLVPTFLMWCASRMSVNFQEIKRSFQITHICKKKKKKEKGNEFVMSQRGKHKPFYASETNLF